LGGQYDRSLPDIFAVQSEIAQTIANRLRTSVSGAKKSDRRKADCGSGSYNLYVRAKALSRITVRMIPMGSKVLQAVELLENAVKRDPNFILAYCLLTEVNLNLYWIREERTYVAHSPEAALRTASVSHLTSEKLTWPARCFIIIAAAITIRSGGIGGSSALVTK